MEHPTSPETESQLIDRIRSLSGPLHPRPTGCKPELDPLTDIHAVLFDIYGTLLISGSGDIGTASGNEDVQAFSDSLKAVELEGQATGIGAERLRQCIRESQERTRNQGVEFPEVDILAVWRAVLGHQTLPADLDDNPLRRLAVEYECRTNPVWPMPGMVELIAALKNRNLPMGIVSNAQFYTPLTLHALVGAGPQSLGFEPELCSWSYRLLEAKPSIRLFQDPLDRLADHHGIRPEQVAYVGNDMLKDIWPASELGCRTVLFAGDQRSLRWRESDIRCQGLKPDRTITRLSQLAELLKS